MKLIKRVEKLEETRGVDVDGINMEEFIEFARSWNGILGYPPDTDPMPFIQSILDDGYRSVSEYVGDMLDRVAATYEPGKLWNEYGGPKKGDPEREKLRKNGRGGA